MRYFFAPMEGMTGYLFRGVHHRMFPGADCYLTPFLTPTQDRRLTPRQLREVMPANNEGVPVVPQLLTRSAADFLWAAEALREMGYEEVNLNLGCPSGTVVAKGKGAGLLRDPAELDRFLNEIFSGFSGRISIKTRLGIADSAEFPALLAVFNRYPISLLTIHPRVQRDFYRRPVRMEAFAEALETCRMPVCYNGDLKTAGDCAAFNARFPAVGDMMLGRGALADPALFRRLRGGPGADRAALAEFHDALCAAYREAFGSDHSAMQRMKEHWSYWICLFCDEDGRAIKRLQKTKTYAAFADEAAGILRNLPLRDEAAAWW